MKAIIKDKKEIAKNVLQVDFTVLDQALSFEPGQYFSIALPDMRYTDDHGNIRYFSICTAPNDGLEFSIVTRLSDSAYKRSLLRMLFGREVELGIVSGTLVLPENKEQQIVMIAGGIGIAPFMSMVRSLNEKIKDKKWAHDVILYYANLNEESTPFLPELKDYDRKVENFSLHLSMTDQIDWEGNDRLVDHEDIKEQIKDYKEAYYLVVGPTGTVRQVVNSFDRLGIQSDHYKLEEFVGY